MLATEENLEIKPFMNFNTEWLVHKVIIQRTLEYLVMGLRDHLSLLGFTDKGI